MPVYRIADLNIEIHAHYPFVLQQCAAYLAPAGARADFSVEVPEEEILASHREKPNFSLGYHESISVYRHLCRALLPYDAFLMHAAVVAYDGRAYAFSAHSGTGKSTHISLWRQVYGDAVTIINGDKPILRRTPDSGFIAYGTPWCGKEGWNRNTSAPLAAICFLERSTENRIRPMASGEAVDHIFGQLLRPKDAMEMNRTISLADALLCTVPMYLLGCNISREAAELSFTTLTRAPRKENL